MRLSRRNFLVGSAGTALLPAAMNLLSSEALGSPAPSARRGPSSGELRVLEPFLPATLDTDGGAPTIVQALGLCESLMRYRSDLSLQPWLATKLQRVGLLTWRVTLRDDVTFWDGSKVDAEAVRASFQRSMDKGGVADLLPRGTTVTPDGLVLTIKTPTPVALMPHNLAAPQLALKKLGADGVPIYTGPFRPVQFTPRATLVAEAYAGYRGGPAWVKTLRAREVADTNTRTLAVQARDVEISQALLPGDVDKLKTSGAQVFSAPWARQHMMVLNVLRPPLSDAEVRRAIALAIDREALVKGVLEGAGTAAHGFAPEEIGFKNIVRAQRYDRAESMKVLDAAGWRVGTGGVREKDGKRLAFKLGTYPGRAELERMAVVILDHLKSVGMDVTIEKFDDVETQLAKNEFDATMYSIGSLAFTELSRLVGLLYTPSSRNKNRYSNPELNRLYADYMASSDSKVHDDKIRRIQDLLKQDTPTVYLANPYQVVAASPKVKDFAPHPLDSYKYHADMRLA
jgi:peptide/nickel transport system substrate-binding protein